MYYIYGSLYFEDQRKLVFALNMNKMIIFKYKILNGIILF